MTEVRVNSDSSEPSLFWIGVYLILTMVFLTLVVIGGVYLYRGAITSEVETKVEKGGSYYEIERLRRYEEKELEGLDPAIEATIEQYKKAKR